MSRLSVVLNNIESRESPAVFNNAFRQRRWGIIPRAWEDFKREITDGKKFSSDVEEEIESIYLNNVLYGQKAVFLWALNKEVCWELFLKLDSFVVCDGNPYIDRFPFALEKGALYSLVGGYRVPTAVESRNGEKTLFYVSKRETFKEVSLPMGDAPEVWIGDGITEIIGRKKSVYQVFDSFSVNPDLGMVELRIDRAKYLSERDVLKYKAALVSEFNIRCKAILGDSYLGDPINLFFALDPLYKGNGWKVNRLGHQNEDGYINYNKGRFRDADVRTARYHKGGEEAVACLDVWGMRVIFSSPSGFGSPTMVIDGGSKILSMQTPIIYSVKILDCACESDYRLVMKSLLDCKEQGENAFSNGTS